jgi:hypothetical protein
MILKKNVDKMFVILADDLYKMYFQSLAPTKSQWARVVGYGPFPLCVIHKESLCPSSEDFNKLMMVIALNGIGITCFSAC